MLGNGLFPSLPPSGRPTNGNLPLFVAQPGHPYVCGRLLLERPAGFLDSYKAQQYRSYLTNSSFLTSEIRGQTVMLQDVHFLGSLPTLTLNVLRSWLLTSGARLLLVLVTAFVLLHTIRTLTQKLNAVLRGLTQSGERQKRAQTLSHIVQAVATTVLLVVTAMLVLGELGVNLAPLIAAAGIGGLAIGFGAQNLVRDVITGFFILLEDQIRIGDVVKVGDKGGLVENISLRVLTLRDLDGSLHLIPHGTITTVTNMTKDYSYSVIDVGVAYREDVDGVMEILKEVGIGLRQDPEFVGNILDDLEVVGVDDFAASQVTIKVRIKTVPSKQWQVSRELRRRIKKVFDARGIEIPFPHLTLYFGEPKRGAVAPLRVVLDSGPVYKPADQEHGSARGGYEFEGHGARGLHRDTEAVPGHGCRKTRTSVPSRTA